MPHSMPVSDAIQAALNDINLLRVLVYARTPDDANDVLTAYSPPLTLKGQDIVDFFNSLQNGRMEISAADLVRYYDRLQPCKRDREIRTKGGEWVP